MAKALQEALVNFKTHMKEHEKPSCFSQEEFVAWKVHEDLIPTHPVRGFVCRDCTRSYQAEMAGAGRCFNSTIELDVITD